MAKGGAPSPTPTVSPYPTPIPSFYQPPAEGTYNPTLQWRVYQPSTSGPWPCVIILHGGGFHGGAITTENDAGSNFIQSATDLQCAGFYVLVASYRLAPNGLILGQYPHDSTTNGVASGRPAEQTGDVKAVVDALRNQPTICNGQLGILAGSAGASHAAYVAIDRNFNTSVWPYWGPDSPPNFVACLSGAFDFSDRSTYHTTDDTEETFVTDIENYTNSESLAVQWSFSPIANLTTNEAITPIYFLDTDFDNMPPHQQWDLYNALYQKGVNSNLYMGWTIPSLGSHEFEYWNALIKDSTSSSFTVGQRVIGWFEYFLMDGNTHF